MPHPIATLALNLAPFAADLVTRMVGNKKAAEKNKSIEQRLSTLEDYEVEQAKLVKQLTDKLEALENRNNKMKALVTLATLLSVIATGISVYSIYIL